MLVYWVIGAFVVIMLFSVYMGLFNKLTVSERLFPGGFFIYYDYQGHVNSVSLFHENLQKAVGVDCSKFARMTIIYDDPFNLRDARTFRASIGFLLKDYDKVLFDKFKALHYEWKSLPSGVNTLSGEFPYRNAASLSFGQQRFLPTCLTYIFRNQRKYKGLLSTMGGTGTIEVIENGMIRYYLVTERQREFNLTTRPQPMLKNENKFTSVYYNKKND
jgi:hypothetical protein